MSSSKVNKKLARLQPYRFFSTCTNFRGKVLKFGLQSEHNWSIIGKVLTEVLKCHESTGNFALILGYWRLEALAFDGFGGSSRILWAIPQWRLTSSWISLSSKKSEFPGLIKLGLWSVSDNWKALLRVSIWGQISAPLGTWGQSCHFGDRPRSLGTVGTYEHSPYSNKGVCMRDSVITMYCWTKFGTRCMSFCTEWS